MTPRYGDLAREVLGGHDVGRSEALGVLRSPDDDLLELLHGAFLLRRARFGRGVVLHVIRNAKSGRCQEDCAYCSQSAASDGEIPRYDMQSVEEIVDGARRAHALGAARYCIVTSGRAPGEEELDVVCESARRIKAELPLALCVSLGSLVASQAARLEAAGVGRYNHNLETSERHFPALCGTHAFPDRVATARAAKAAGMELCSGVLLGTGETLEDRVDVAFALKDLGADAIPVNLLDPRPGTRLAAEERITPEGALRALAMFRFVHPDKEIRIAGGRERILGPLQALALYPANSMFTNGYLTSPGQGYEADLAMLKAAGFEPAGFAE
ncbi:MAG: biotin synthase BioB [Deltaproteobacteria bacterium]|nr:biotin synthase BioB [Deltaproteobacteria bacterium]